jgi:hypothetical protein
LAAERDRSGIRRPARRTISKFSRTKSKFFTTKSKPGSTNSKSSATKSKLKSLDCLRRIEPFQGVTPTPAALFLFWRRFRPCADGSIDVAYSPRVVPCSCGPSFSGPPVFRIREGLAPIAGSRLCETLGRYFPPDLPAASLIARKKGPPWPTEHPRVISPGTEDPTEKTGRSIRCPARIRPLERTRSGSSLC